MAKKLTIFTLAAVVCIFSLASAAPYNGIITVESKAVSPGQSFTINVSLTGNDVDLTSLRIPLHFDNSYLTCTYVSFTGSIIDGSMTGYSAISGSRVDISFIPPVVNPQATISVESGLIATLYFTVDVSTPGGTLDIDSIDNDIRFEQYSQTFHLWDRVEAADGNGDDALIPSFSAGAIEVSGQTAVDDENRLMPDEFELIQNYPNPFNPTTTIAFSLPEKMNVRLDIYNVLGQNVKTLVDDELTAGQHEIVWDAADAPSGVYFYRLSVKNESITKKMILLK